MIKFPHVRGHEVPDALFLAMWKIWFKRFDRNACDPASEGLPRLQAHCRLHEQLEKKREFSLDVLCRWLAPPPARDTAQASAAFMDENAHLLERVNVINPVTGRKVAGARLTEHARALLSKLEETWCVDAEAMVEGDIDLENKQGERTLCAAPLTEVVPTITDTWTPPTCNSTTRQGLVVALVDWIENDPFQPMYRRRPLKGQRITGWSARLGAYFWPSPTVGYQETIKRLAPLLRRAEALARTCTGTWTPEDGGEAVDVANLIFEWGGVRQANVTANVVQLVVRSAVEKTDLGAPMNSGWTKVAAMCTAHLEHSGAAQAIWDSRVSNSLITRLDALLAQTGTRNIPDHLSGLGEVPGRGGTRGQRRRNIKWPNAYGKWSSHFAAAELVRDLRDQLNTQRVFKSPGNHSSSWTTRDVEMVLFMDGY